MKKKCYVQSVSTISANKKFCYAWTSWQVDLKTWPCVTAPISSQRRHSGLLSFFLSFSQQKWTQWTVKQSFFYKQMTGILLVSTWRHGGHVGGQEQKHFSPLGTKRYFHGNFSRKNFIVLTADPQNENLKFFSTLWARRPTRVEITSPVDDFMERFERGTQVEGCDITHMWKTEKNTENLKKQNNHIKKSTNEVALHKSWKQAKSFFWPPRPSTKIREFKQRRFQVMHVTRKWTFWFFLGSRISTPQNAPRYLTG